MKIFIGDDSQTTYGESYGYDNENDYSDGYGVGCGINYGFLNGDGSGEGCCSVGSLVMVTETEMVTVIWEGKLK